jgi:electron transfer flavoprotein alpha subunit
MSKDVQLGLFDEIDSGFKRWSICNIGLKKILIESDVEIYTRAHFSPGGNCSARVTAEMISIIDREFLSISDIGSDMMKIIYTEFISGIVKPPQKVSRINQREFDDDGDEAYTLRDEYNAVLEIQKDEEEAKEEDEKYAKQVDIVNKLTIDASLSAVEKAALAFIKHKEIDSLLEIFTMNGIIQIANRAAYKLYSIHV